MRSPRPSLYRSGCRITLASERTSNPSRTTLDASAIAAWLVGLTITAAYWFTASTSFANPAVTLARGFTTTFAGIAINHVPGFIIAQLIGALVAAGVCGVLLSSCGERQRGLLGLG